MLDRNAQWHQHLLTVFAIFVYKNSIPEGTNFRFVFICFTFVCCIRVCQMLFILCDLCQM